MSIRKLNQATDLLWSLVRSPNDLEQAWENKCNFIILLFLCDSRQNIFFEKHLFVSLKFVNTFLHFLKLHKSCSLFAIQVSNYDSIWYIYIIDLIPLSNLIQCIYFESQNIFKYNVHFSKILNHLRNKTKYHKKCWPLLI